MNKKTFTNLSFLLVGLVLLAIPAHASASTPEIPAGFGPIVVSGIALATSAIKGFRNKE